MYTFRYLCWELIDIDCFLELDGQLVWLTEILQQIYLDLHKACLCGSFDMPPTLHSRLFDFEVRILLWTRS